MLDAPARTTRLEDAVERLSGIPIWLLGMIGTSWVGLVVAGVGFYDDVSWHIGRGRDEEIFTPPHTAIVVGLQLIALAGVVGILLATRARLDTKLRWGRWRVPWSSIPLLLLGSSALLGFPLDELWHRRYGVDVTMWSPTHLLMIVGASLSPLVAWLGAAEAGLRPQKALARVAFVAVGWATLAGLSSVQAEFEFGVPQFQQLYHPVLVLLAAAFVFTGTRVVLGPSWSLLISSVAFVRFGQDMLVTTRSAGLYIGSALAVEAVAWVVGTQRRLRFALYAGAAVATGGLATEWWWNTGARQPWNSSLLPEAVLVGLLAALGAAVLGVAWAGVATRSPLGVSKRALVVAGLALLVALALPHPRGGSDVTASLTLDRRGDTAVVTAEIDPPDAVDGARWFHVISWQGGGLVLADMDEVAPGVYRSERPVPVTGDWKTMVRLHRGAEMTAVPVYLPADEEYGEPAIPAVDRQARFVREGAYLQREAEAGAPGLAVGIYTLVGLLAAAWIATFCLTAAKLRE